MNRDMNMTFDYKIMPDDSTSFLRVFISCSSDSSDSSENRESVQRLLLIPCYSNDFWSVFITELVDMSRSAEDGSRTHTPVRALDFKSSASASFATPA